MAAMAPSTSDRSRRGDGQPLAVTILFLLPFFSFKPSRAIPAEKAHMASPPGGSSSVTVPVLPAWSWRGVGYQDRGLGDDDKGDRLELQVRKWPCFCRAGLQYVRSIQLRVHGDHLLIRYPLHLHLQEDQQMMDEMGQYGIPLSVMSDIAEIQLLDVVDKVLENKCLRKTSGIQPKFPHLVDSFEERSATSSLRSPLWATTAPNIEGFNKE